MSAKHALLRVYYILVHCSRSANISAAVRIYDAAENSEAITHHLDAPGRGYICARREHSCTFIIWVFGHAEPPRRRPSSRSAAPPAEPYIIIIKTNTRECYVRALPLAFRLHIHKCIVSCSWKRRSKSFQLNTLLGIVVKDNNRSE